MIGAPVGTNSGRVGNRRFASMASMSPFPILFFIFVEVPSMAAMLVHKGIMQATGNQTQPLNVWLYRLAGVAVEFVVLMLSFVIGLDAACGLLVLIVMGGLIALAVRKGNAGAAIGPQTPPTPATLPALPGVLGELSRRSLDDLNRANGRPSGELVDVHLRSADLMAALRYYQIAVDPRVTDLEIANQLSLDAPGTMTRVEQVYRDLPPSRERDVAIEILRAYRPQGLAVTGNIYTSFARNALREAAQRRP